MTYAPFAWCLLSVSRRPVLQGIAPCRGTSKLSWPWYPCVMVVYTCRTLASRNEGHRLRSILNSRICKIFEGSNKCFNLLCVSAVLVVLRCCCLGGDVLVMWWSCAAAPPRTEIPFLIMSVVVFDCAASLAAGRHGPLQEAGVESQGGALCGRVRFTHSGVIINCNLAQYTSVHSQIVEVAQTILQERLTHTVHSTSKGNTWIISLSSVLRLGMKLRSKLIRQCHFLHIHALSALCVALVLRSQSIRATSDTQLDDH